MIILHFSDGGAVVTEEITRERAVAAWLDPAVEVVTVNAFQWANGRAVGPATSYTFPLTSVTRVSDVPDWTKERR